MRVKPKNTKMIVFEQILREFCSDSNRDNSSLFVAEQVQNIADKTGAKLISIGNIVMEADELIGKLTQIELTILKHGDNEATKLWDKFGLPKLKTYKRKIK